MSKKPNAQIRKMRELAKKRFAKHKRLNETAVAGSSQCIIVLDHLKPDFNIGKIFRSADAFAVHEVHLVDVDYFDPSPAKGSFKWVPARFFATVEEVISDLTSRGYSIFALDPEADESLDEVSFPEKSAFIFGHEEFGLSFSPDRFENVQLLSIKQFGQVQSLNVSIAASLLMYEYTRQYPQKISAEKSTLSDTQAS